MSDTEFVRTIDLRLKGKNKEKRYHSISCFIKLRKFPISEILDKYYNMYYNKYDKKYEKEYEMKERLSITLNDELYKEVKKRAKELKESVSHIVERAIEVWRRDEVEERLRQYYLNASTEHGKIVKDAESMIKEIWKEEEGGY